MKNKILLSTFGAVLLLAAATALALAWPNQPPDKVLISGPGIEGQVEVNDKEALEIFRLGTLEDLKAESPLPPLSPAPVEFGAGFKIVRFFYGGEFNFAQLTYYPDQKAGRGYLFWEDGPDLTGDSTEYNRTWLYTNAEAERKLRALLINLGAKLDAPARSNIFTSNAANAKSNASRNSPVNNPAQQPSQANGAASTTAIATTSLSPVVPALVVGAVAVLGAVTLFLLRRARRSDSTR